MKNLKLPYLLIAIIVLATIIRLINLDYLTLWVDEYVHALRAKDFIQKSGSMFTEDNNGILLTIFITPLYALFEINEFWARFPSVLFAIGSIIMIYKLGKSLFSQNIGLISALLLSASHYHVFWSRIARNYSIFMFFMLICFYLIHTLYKANIDKKKGIKTTIVLFVTFILSLLSHNLSFFLIFGYAFYIIGNFIHNKFILKVNDKFLSKNKLPLIPSILLFVLVLVPIFGDLIRPILSIFLPSKVVSWVIPDWDYLGELWKTKPYKSWNLYIDVIKFDLVNLYYLGGIGFIIALIKKTKSGIFIFSFFIPTLLLMSFVFREPVLPRYLLGIYPLFIISIAVTADYFLSLFLGKILPNKPQVVLGISLLILLGLSPISDIYSMVSEKKHGRVVPKQLSHWNFANWKEPATRVKNKMQDGDAVMSTNLNASLFYLNLNDEDPLYSFRQRKYDVETRKYIQRNTDNSKAHAFSLKGVMDIYSNNERGWLLADYYFENVMTDPKTRQFIIQNLDYHYNLGNEYIKVFSWDKTRPLKHRNHILEELGRDGIKYQSLEYGLVIPKNDKETVTLMIEAQGIDFNNELFVFVNKKTRLQVDPKTGELYRKNKNRWARQKFYLTVKKSAFKKGNNTVQFKFNNKVKNERIKGCVVFKLSVVN